jgi:hypothetical protein
MDGTSTTEHDLWMEKITLALRSFRTASLRKAEQAEAQRSFPTARGAHTAHGRSP